MKTTTRAEAIAANLKTYFTGVPCKNGHVSERRTKTYVCEECNRILMRENMRAVPATIKRRRQSEYYHRNAAQILARRRRANAARSIDRNPNH